MSDPFSVCSLNRPLQMQIALVVTEEAEATRRVRPAVAVRTRNKTRDSNDLPCSRKAGIQLHFAVTRHAVD